MIYAPDRSWMSWNIPALAAAGQAQRKGWDSEIAAKYAHDCSFFIAGRYTR
tara:strand:- start:236 stop:388 length:153 start_codon:yes stop_codon:yes gene_type:complete